MAVEAFNDLGLIQEMAAGMLIMYNMMQIVLQCRQAISSKALSNTPPFHFQDGGYL